MSCDQLKKYEIGELEENEFRKHLKSCASCQENVKLDTRLMSLAKSLKKPVQAPLLWDRIEKSLKEEQQKLVSTRAKSIRWRPLSLIPAAAVLLLAVSIGLYFWLRPEQEEPRLLAEAALKKVEKKESEYIKAIAEMEKRVLPKMAALDMELMFLYRDRLETIDDQIERCKEALAENPANSHIRQYMLAALQDKKQTLKEILSSKQQILR